MLHKIKLSTSTLLVDCQGCTRFVGWVSGGVGEQVRDPLLFPGRLNPVCRRSVSVGRGVLISASSPRPPCQASPARCYCLSSRVLLTCIRLTLSPPCLIVSRPGSPTSFYGSLESTIRPTSRVFGPIRNHARSLLHSYGVNMYM
jgi:hypothetical protein